MPDWLPDFLNDSLLYGPFYQIASAIWNTAMSACMGIMTKTPEGFSSATWTYVNNELYPWALSIGIMSLNFFVMMGFFKAVGNFKENMTIEEADKADAYLKSITGIDDVTVYERTGDQKDF